MSRKILVRLPKLNDAEGDLDKKWFIYFSVRNPKTGKMERFKKYEKLHKSKTLPERYEKAEQQISKWTDLLKAGWTPFENEKDLIYEDQLQYNNIAKIYGRKRATNRTFGFYASKFIDTLTGMERSTIITYTSKLRVTNMYLEKTGLHENDISTLRQIHIFHFFEWLINVRKLSRNSIKKYRQLLVKVFELAIKEHAVSACPVHSLPVCLRETDMAARPVQQLDIKRILEYADANDPQLGLFVRFEFNCFMRPHELRFMKIKWIDFGAGTITTPRNVLKTKHDRVSVIPEKFLNELKKIDLHSYSREFYLFGKHRKPGPEPTGKNTMRNRFVIVRKVLNLPNEYKLYSWKHSGNVRAEQQDIPMIDRMHQNGHTSIQTTEVYTRNKIGRTGNAFREFDSI